jgi:hypothetical protein
MYNNCISDSNGSVRMILNVPSADIYLINVKAIVLKHPASLK